LTHLLKGNKIDKVCYQSAKKLILLDFSMVRDVSKLYDKEEKIVPHLLIKL